MDILKSLKKMMDEINKKGPPAQTKEERGETTIEEQEEEEEGEVEELWRRIRKRQRSSVANGGIPYPMMGKEKNSTN